MSFSQYLFVCTIWSGPETSVFLRNRFYLCYIKVPKRITLIGDVEVVELESGASNASHRVKLVQMCSSLEHLCAFWICFLQNSHSITWISFIYMSSITIKHASNCWTSVAYSNVLQMLWIGSKVPKWLVFVRFVIYYPHRSSARHPQIYVGDSIVLSIHL